MVVSHCLELFRLHMLAKHDRKTSPCKKKHHIKKHIMIDLLQILHFINNWSIKLSGNLLKDHWFRSHLFVAIQKNVLHCLFQFPLWLDLVFPTWWLLYVSCILVLWYFMYGLSVFSIIQHILMGRITCPSNMSKFGLNRLHCCKCCVNYNYK